MRSKPLCWKAFVDAQAFHCRPSDLLGIDNDYVAYCLDSAVATWGAFVMGEIHDMANKGDKEYAKAKANQIRLIERLLGMPPSESTFRQAVVTDG